MGSRDRRPGSEVKITGKSQRSVEKSTAALRVRAAAGNVLLSTCFLSQNVKTIFMFYFMDDLVDGLFKRGCIVDCEFHCIKLKAHTMFLIYTA